MYHCVCIRNILVGVVKDLGFIFFVRKYGITVCIRDILVGVVKDLGFIFLYVNTVSLYVFGIYW